MNKRQKAKHFKRLYEAIANLRIQPTIISDKKTIKRYKVRQTVEASYMNQMSDDVECPLTHIKRQMTRNLADTILNDVTFNMEPSYIPDHVDIVREIDVAVAKEG